ncbi:MAG: NAD(P)-binding domain-containing protein, partial [Gammaproteobacteria bacterium]
ARRALSVSASPRAVPTPRRAARHAGMTPGATTLLGLGRMGSALAGCLLTGGVPLTLWNRSPARCAAFHGRATIAPSAAAACTDSELIIVSLANYSAALEVLDAVSAAVPLAGRTLVQLTSGSASDARTLQAWAHMHGLGYLDCAVIAHPQAVGGSDAIVLCAGDEALWERHQATLRLFGGTCRYLGEDIGAAATLDCAVLDYYYGATLAMLHGAALTAAGSLPLTEYFFLVKKLAPALAATADGAREMIAREIYAGNACTLDVHVAMLRHIQRMSHDNELDTRLPDTLVQAYRKAIAAGYGEDEIAAVFEVLRRDGER